MRRGETHRLLLALVQTPGPGRVLGALLTLALLLPGPAQASEWILTLKEREDVRQKEKWYFSEHLAGKGQSRRLDLLYRFFLGSRTPKPRVELVGGGFGQLTDCSVGESSQAVGLGRQGVGYGGRLAFNNFVSGLTGLRTINMVPNLSARVIQSSFAASEVGFAADANRAADSETVGAGFRLMGQNLADTALYVDYERRRAIILHSPERQNLEIESFETWLINLRAELYLFPALAFTGSVVLDEDAIEAHERSKTHSLKEFGFGGQLDLAMLRISYAYLDRTYRPRAEALSSSRNKEVIHTVGLSLIF